MESGSLLSSLLLTLLVLELRVGGVYGDSRDVALDPNNNRIENLVHDGELTGLHGFGFSSSGSFNGDLAAGTLDDDGKDDVVQAWYLDESEEDQRLPHQREPKELVPLDRLADLGILAMRLDADNYERDDNLRTLREERGYSYMDIADLDPKNMPNYDAMLKRFFEEHLHTDEEVRYCLQGSGYFDVRDENDQWIRVAVKKGGLIVIPAGIYHRFIVDMNNYIKAMRLFSGSPIWTAYNRPHDHLPARKQYLEELLKNKERKQAEEANI